MEEPAKEQRSDVSPPAAPRKVVKYGNTNRRKKSRSPNPSSVRTLYESIMLPQTFKQKMFEAGYTQNPKDDLSWEVIRLAEADCDAKRSMLSASARWIIRNICNAKAVGIEITSIKIVGDDPKEVKEEQGVELPAVPE